MHAMSDDAYLYKGSYSSAKCRKWNLRFPKTIYQGRMQKDAPLPRIGPANMEIVFSALTIMTCEAFDN